MMCYYITFFDKMQEFFTKNRIFFKKSHNIHSFIYKYEGLGGLILSKCRIYARQVIDKVA